MNVGLKAATGGAVEFYNVSRNLFTGYVAAPIIGANQKRLVDAWRLEKLQSDLEDTKIAVGRPANVIASAVSDLEQWLDCAATGTNNARSTKASKPSPKSRKPSVYDQHALSQVDHYDVVSRVVELMYKCEIEEIVISSVPGYCGWRAAVIWLRNG